MRQRLTFLVVSACAVRAFCSIVTGPVCDVRLWAAFASGVGLTAARADLVSFERDLSSRTLVGWGGEMGRGGKGNPNHNGNAFTWWMAGGPVPRGTVYGGTDELGRPAVEKPIYVRDLYAPILWMCGLDHTKLQFNAAGFDDSCNVASELSGLA
ncbi:MAG: DUF1501 domain-containing protein [Rubripirellula sp.]|jgi:hypothetical protein|nr:DUF1501 domain-containing protein [Rubripirellula sp.]